MLLKKCVSDFQRFQNSWVFSIWPWIKDDKYYLTSKNMTHVAFPFKKKIKPFW